MKKSSSNPEKASPLMNLAIIIVLLLTALPIVLFAIVQINPPSFGTSSVKTVQTETETKRSTIAERRAEREEARKENEAPAKNPAPIITTTTVMPGPGMGPGMDFGPGMMGPGMDFGPGGFGGPGGMDFGPGGLISSHGSP